MAAATVPLRVSPTKTKAAGPLPIVLKTFDVPGFPLPVVWMSTPFILATMTAKSMLPTTYAAMSARGMAREVDIAADDMPRTGMEVAGGRL